MIRLIGCLIILICSTSWGFIFAAGYAKRIKELRSFQYAFQILESEIMFTSTPLPRAISRISRLSDGPVNGLFDYFKQILDRRAGHTAGEAWDMAVNVKRDALCLDDEDIDIILSFGKGLGTTDKENQGKSFELTKYQLMEQLKKAEEKRNTNERLYRSLGFLLGAALIILLI